MTFALSTVITEKIQQAGIPINGVSYNSKIEDPIRIDFTDEATDEQKSQAEAIAAECLQNKEQLQQEWEAAEASRITPEKVQPLVNLLVEKGILTEEEIASL